MIMKRKKIMMKMVTVHLVEELCDARKGESGNPAFDRFVGCFQLVQEAHLMAIIISVMKAPTMIFVTMMLNRRSIALNCCERRT